MSNQEKVIQILKELKDIKIPVSSVEKEIGVGSGYLWKVKEGIKPLNDDKLKLLVDLRDKKCKPKVLPKKEIKKVVPKEIIPVIKNKSMPKGLSVVEQLEWRAQNAG